MNTSNPLAGSSRAAVGDEHGLGRQDRVAEDLEVGLAQRAAGLDDVGDRVGHTESHRRLDRPVEAHDGGLDAAFGEVRLDQALVGGGDARAGEVG